MPYEEFIIQWKRKAKEDHVLETQLILKNPQERRCLQTTTPGVIKALELDGKESSVTSPNIVLKFWEQKKALSNKQLQLEWKSG